MTPLLSRIHTCTPITLHNPTVTDVASTCLEALTEAPLTVRVTQCILAERLVVDVYVGTHLVIENLRDVYIFLPNGPLRFTLCHQAFLLSLRDPYLTAS